MLGDENMEWLEQHHKKTMNKNNFNAGSQTDLHAQNNAHNQQSAHFLTVQQAIHSSPGFDYPQSGDESDNNHNQMEHLRSQFYTPDPQKRTKEYHMEQAAQAVEHLKAAAASNGWKKVDKHKAGCVVYQSTSEATIPGHGDHKYPAFKGEHTIRGFSAQDVFSIVSVRKLWDDWYDELSCVETYDDATTLMYMVMKGTMSSKTRDVAMVERVHVDSDGTIYFAACSVESSKVPRIPGRVRADIFLAGWILQPLPSNPPITKITYVIHTDLLSRLPKFIAKRSLAKRAMAIATVETHLKKNGAPNVGISNSHATQRPRSLSEPVKLDHFLLPQDSDEDLTSGSAFLSSLDPAHYMSDIEWNPDDEPEPVKQQQQHLQPPQPPPRQRPPPTKAPSTATRSSVTSSTLFTQEFLDSSSFLGDSTLLSDAPISSKDVASDGPEKKQESVVAPPPPKARPQPPTKQQPAPERKALEKTRPPPVVSRTLSPQSEKNKTQSTKRVSIPVVLPKSEARQKQYTNGSSMAVSSQSLVPETATLMPIITPATPPLTPTASVDGRDGTSDSDSAKDPPAKVVPRAPKPVPESGDAATTSRPSSLAMSSMIKSPSAMMEARRHSALMGRSAAFVPRHSHAVPIRGNPNVSLQSLSRPSGPNGTMTTAMKRHSTAPSLDSNRSMVTFTPMMVLPHRHSETARKALAMFKVLASSSEDRWRAISSENGFKSYSRIISGAGLPMLRGEGTITGGWTVEQINAVIESAGCRHVWDERFENMSIAETFNHNEYLFHITLRGIGSLTGRDLAGVTIIDRDPQTSALYNVSTSVLDPTIPEDPGRIRAMLELSGWSLRPTFDGQGNTVSVNVTYVIQIDIRGSLPSSVVKSMTASMTTAVARLNQFINKTGYPPFASHISGTRLLDTFEPKTGFYELCYKAAPGWTEVRVGRKVYKEGYDFFIKPDDPSVKVELAPDFGGVRVWTTLDHEGQSIIAQVSRKGQNAIEPEIKEEEEEKQEADTKQEIEADKRHSVPAARKQRSASCTVSTPHNSSPLSSPTSPSSSRPDSQTSTGRGRVRTPRNIVTLPAGTPPPPLPRRSSSLSRYSIPISTYLPGADAPPVPISSAITAGDTSVRSSTASGLESMASPVTSPVSAKGSLTLPLVPGSGPVSESPFGSPTLGPFHVPHAPVVSTPNTPTTTEAKRPISQMESISNVLSESLPATPTPGSTIESPKATSTVATAETPKVKPISMSKDDESLNKSPVSTPPPKERKDIQTVSSLAALTSPTASPLPTFTPTFGPRGSSLNLSASSTMPITTITAAAAAVPTPTFQPTSSLKHSPSALSVGSSKKREVRVTFSMDTIDKSSDESKEDLILGAQHLAMSGSPLDNVLKLSHNSLHAPNMAKEHMVQVVSAAHYHQQQGVVEEMSEYESDEAEFVEARDELSEDEMELALVLTGIGSWPSSSSSMKQEHKEKEEEVMMASIQAVERGLRNLAAGSSFQVKAAIVFLLLVYYAGRLSSFIV
ncbi:hypothetical protein BGZ51_007396 [Haplosporangium sp. Z 767]|nr:hypothetical protein BGZ50_001897 [Haplosporangium sp. Z 11]KAF9191393.1 hypothetical protein BGZ51_007396 [Haplosporangium sp. Z 767]